MKYYIDDTIDLFAICETAQWHRQQTIDALVSAGIERTDAEAFAEFAFNEAAIENGGAVDTYDSGDLITAEQDERLSFR